VTDFTQAEITAYYAERVPATMLKSQTGHYWRCGCPVHQGTDPNFAVDRRTGLAKCHSRCGKGWDIFSLEMELSSLDFPTAKTKVFRLIGRADPKWEERDFEAVYDYVDESGKLRYQVVRRYGKKFTQRQPDGAGGWIWGLKGTEWVPFNLPDVVKAGRVWIVEGEKDAITLGRLGLVGTCNNGGAGHFKPELARWFTGKHVAILPDNDEPGRDHALKVAALLSGKAASVKIVELVGLPQKGDVTDFVSAGGELATIEEAYARAVEWSPEWEFHTEIPSENDRYIRTFEQAIDESGGMDKFWNLLDQQGMETPFENLTRTLGGGMRNGEVYVIGADQGAGKSSLAMQFIIHAMRKKVGVLMFSMEMSWRDVFQRLASIQARVDLQEYREFLRLKRDGPLLKEMRMRLATATAELCQYTLFVSNKTGVTPDHLLTESARLKKRKPVSLVVVDHMQLMATTGNVRGDYEKFTAISRACKETAMQMKVPLILVSQTSRSHTADKRTELEVSDLRGSGAIEEDAAAVLLLYADKQDRDLAKDDGRLMRGPVQSWLKVGKNRFGEQFRYLKLAHMKKYTRFDEYTPEAAHVA
jgi:KaiC/GvpD/RAD55 family RecA-like ATPase/5S rRNA maturation endonuclease (ribonuclease M5)